MSGHYAFRYRSVDKGDPNTVDHLWAIGSFVADGKGAISGGKIDLNDVNRGQTSAPLTAAFTGTYSVSADGRGTGTLTVQKPGGAESVPLRWVMISNTAARMIDFDDTGSGWGNIDMQDPSAFSAGLSGTYVFSYDGLQSGLWPNAAAGMFNADAGVISSGLGDFNDQNGVRQADSFEGSYTSPDPSTGRGTWVFTDPLTRFTWSFAYYLLNSSTFVFSSTDQSLGTLGVAVQQDTSSSYTNGSFSGDSIFVSSGYDVVQSAGVATTSAGRITAGGNGTLTDGVFDINGNGNISMQGAYSISANGRGAASLTSTTDYTTHNIALYMLAPNNALWVSLDPIVASTGQFMPQASGTYDNSTLHGSFAIAVRGTFVSADVDASGQMTADGAGNLMGTADMNAAGTLAPDTSFTGTDTISSNGRGQVAVALGGSTVNYVIYLVSGRTAFLVPIDSGAPAALALAYRQF